MTVTNGASACRCVSVRTSARRVKSVIYTVVLKNKPVRGAPWQVLAHVQSVQVQVQAMVHYKPFSRSSTTFTSALLLSSKLYPYIRVALRDKVVAPPRLNVAELSLYSINLFLIMLNQFYDLPPFLLSGGFGRK